MSEYGIQIRGVRIFDGRSRPDCHWCNLPGAELVVTSVYAYNPADWNGMTGETNPYLEAWHTVCWVRWALRHLWEGVEKKC